MTRDVRELAGLLGLTRLYVAGWSGGGPHALACGALLPDLVAGVATIAGVAPFDAEGLDWLAGMGPENEEEFAATVAGPDELQALLEPYAADLATVDRRRCRRLVRRVDLRSRPGGPDRRVRRLHRRVIP